jgi:hypothetical protein
VVKICKNRKNLPSTTVHGFLVGTTMGVVLPNVLVLDNNLFKNDIIFFEGILGNKSLVERWLMSTGAKTGGHPQNYVGAFN